MMKVTQDDLLDALRTALEKPGAADGVTRRELAILMGCADEKARRALVALAAEGRLDVVRVRRPSIDGRNMLVAAYRIKPAANGKRKP